MAFENRLPVLNFSGSLAAGCTALDTTISSASFNDSANPLPVVSPGTPQTYIPLVLADDAAGKMEVVYVTSHLSGANTATVVRGREGTAAQAFNAGNIVRCAPTPWDFVPTFTRAGLPADGFYGMRAYVSNENPPLIVEKTSTGWDDSAPFKNDASRKHRWTQSGANLAQINTSVIVSGLSATQNGTTGNIATMSGGKITLNRVGVWSLTVTMYGTNSNSRNQGVTMNWPGGAFPGGNTLYQIGAVFGNGGAPSIAGNGLSTLSWSGFVPPAAAATPIEFQVFSTITMTNCQYDFFAEYLGG